MNATTASDHRAAFDACDRLRIGAPLSAGDDVALLEYIGSLEHKSRRATRSVDALLDALTACSPVTKAIEEAALQLPTIFVDMSEAAAAAHWFAQLVLFNSGGTCSDARRALELWNTRCESPLARHRLDAIRHHACQHGGRVPT